MRNAVLFPRSSEPPSWDTIAHGLVALEAWAKSKGLHDCVYRGGTRQMWATMPDGSEEIVTRYGAWVEGYVVH